MRRRVPAWPLRRMLLGWQARHGDDVSTIARGFGLPVPLVNALLGEFPVRWLSVAQARQACVGLRAHPQEIWSPRAAARLGLVDWETELLWSDAGVDPMIVAGPGRRAGGWPRIR